MSVHTVGVGPEGLGMGAGVDPGGAGTLGGVGARVGGTGGLTDGEVGEPRGVAVGSGHVVKTLALVSMQILVIWSAVKPVTGNSDENRQSSTKSQTKRK